MSDRPPTPASPARDNREDEDPAEQLQRLWGQGRAPDVDAFLAQVGMLAPAVLVDMLLTDQRQRWQAGEKVLVEAYLERHPGVRADAECALDLIYGEFLLREELGERPTLEEYARRFPGHAEALRVQVELHWAMPTEAWREDNEDVPATDWASVPALPGYKVLGELGRGGMGVVYKARQLALDRLVAIKVILAGTHADAEQQRRFQSEAEAVARLRHPNVVQVYDSGVSGGWPYLVLEFVEGGTLFQKVAGNPQPPREAAQTVETLAAAIHHAHRLDLVHRDLKPANVLLTEDGVLKVTDFGLVKRLDRGTAQTGSGTLMGTPAYMAPEQVSGSQGAVGPATDVYALGVILYELLTSRPPFQGDSVLEVLRQVQEHEPLPPSRLRGSVPRDLETICLKCLEKEPGRRYATAAVLAEDLRRFQAGEPIRARPVGVMERSWRWCRRNPLGAAVAGLLLVIAVGASALSLGLSAALTRAHDAEDDAQRQLFDSLVNQALAETRSRRSGQRFASLALLDKAGEQARRLNLPPEKLDDLRNATLAALLMPDLFPAPGDGLPIITGLVDFDDALEVYARTDERGNCSVRRVEGDQEIHSLPDPDPVGPQSLAVLSRDARFIAVKSYDAPSALGRVRLWRLDGSRPEVLPPAENVYWIDFRPDSKLVAFSHDGGAISLYDLTSGQPLRPLEPNALTHEVRIALHPTEPLMAVWSYFSQVAQVRDVRTGEVVQALREIRHCYDVAWHPAGHTLAVSDEGGFHLYDRATFRRRLTFGTAVGGERLFFNHAGDRLCVYNWAGSLCLYDVATGQLVFQVYAHVPLVSPRFDRDDRRLAGFVKDGRIGIWQVADGREYRTLTDPTQSPDDGISSATVSPDGRLLAAAIRDGIGFWDLDTGALLDRLRLNEPRFALFEPGPEEALLTGDASGTFRWPIRRDAAAPGRRRFGPPQPLSLPPGAAVRSDDGRTLATGFRAVDTYQPWAGAWIWHATRPDSPLHLAAGSDLAGVALSPDGRWLVTARHEGGPVELWDARTGQLQRTLARSGNYPHFSPDGRWLTIGGADGRLFEVATWEERPWTGHHFAPDSRTLVAWTDTHALRLVEAVTGRELARLEDPHLDRSHAFLFTPDGGRLLTVNYSKGVHVWDLRLLRAELSRLRRDWDPPPYARPSPPTPVPQGQRDSGSLRLEFERGDYARLSEALAVENFDRAVWEAPKLAVRRYLRGLFHQRAGRAREALADLRRAVEMAPKRHSFVNALAWLYATGPEEVRDGEKAVELARGAIQLQPGEWTYHTTLGIAYFRTGRYADAITALEKSLTGAAERLTTIDLYFLAMCHHRCGDAARACERFEQARARHEQRAGRLSPAEVEELKRFRAEATTVLGRPPSKSAPERPSTSRP